MDCRVESTSGIEVEFVAVLESRSKKRESLNMVPVEMRKKNVSRDVGLMDFADSSATNHVLTQFANT